MTRTGFTIAATALLLVALPGLTAAEVQIAVVAEKEIETVTPAGETVLERVEAERAVPGDEIVYTISYANRSDESADDVKITNPIPEHMVFMTADPVDDAVVTFSVDGGINYDVSRNLQVVDATGYPRPAEAADFTHIRWTFPNPLDPGAAGTVGFRAELQ